MSYRIEVNDGNQKEIIIDGFEKGIGKDQFSGITDMRNIDINTEIGCACINAQPTNIEPVQQSTTFTADPATDIITVSSSLRYTFPTGASANGRVVNVSNSGGALPTGLSAGVNYYIISDSSSTTFKLASSYANFLSGTAVNITGAGSGTNTISTIEMGIAVDSCIYDNSYTNNTQFVIDINGRIWVYSNPLANLNKIKYGQWILLTSTTTAQTLGSGNSLRINCFQDWLFVFRGTSIDVYGKIQNMTTTGDWYNGWKTITSNANPHVNFIGSDNKLYWGDQSTGSSSIALGYIGSLGQGTSGALIFSDTNNPTTSNATTHYSFNSLALDLPSGYYPTSINELGTNLMIGTNQDKIFPWDRVSDSFSFPLTTPEMFIDKMLNINSVLYIFSGISGVCYKTNGAQTVEVFRIPRHLYYSGGYTNFTNTQWGAVAVIRNRIYFSAFFRNSQDNNGIWCYDLNKDTLVIDNKLPNATSLSQIAWVILPLMVNTNIYSSSPSSNIFYQFIYSNTSSSGDTAHIYNNAFTQIVTYYNDYSSYIISDTIPVGTNLRNTNFQQIEFKMARPLLSTEGVKLYYRTNANEGGAFTEIGEYLYDSNRPSEVSAVFNASIEDVEWLQIKVGLKANSGTTSLLPLKEIRIR